MLGLFPEFCDATILMNFFHGPTVNGTGAPSEGDAAPRRDQTREMFVTGEAHERENITGGKLSARVPMWQVCQEVNVECLVGVLRHEWANILGVFLLALMFFLTLLGVERWHARRRFRAHQPPVMKRRTRTTERVTRGDRRGVANLSLIHI